MADAMHGPGTMVTPRIRLQKMLGEGGMGTVWIAEHLGLSTRVAVKFVARELWEKHPELAKRFVREASSAARIASPHVVRTFDFGAMDDGTPFLVMELLEGESLGERIARGPLPAVDVALIVSHVGKALEEAHRLGIVHRDIKPANIFLTRSGRELFAKVLDFGIARDTEAAPSAVTRSGVMLGTPQYMSPEQLMSAKAADGQADLWALAVTAYEALVGKPPFGGETMPSLVVAIHARQFEPPSTSRRAAALGLSPALDIFFGRAFSVNADDRFPSASAFADAFSGACNGIAPPPPSPVEAGRTSYGTPVDSVASRSPLDSVVSRPPVDVVVTGAPAVRVELGAKVSAHATTLGAAASSATLPSHGAPRAASRRRTAARSMAPWIVAGATALGAGLVVAWAATRKVEGPSKTARAHTSASDGEGDEPADDEASLASARSAALAASAAASGALTPLKISVAEGPSPAAAAWFPAFGLVREAEPRGSLVAALDLCHARGSVLCTEPQWKAACAVDGKLGSHTSWLATIDGGKPVVRGGDGCGKRDLAADGDSAPRAVACCDRSIGSIGAGQGFLRGASMRIQAWENAMNSGRSGAVAALYDDEVDFLGTRRTKEELTRLGVDYFRNNPVQKTIYGACEVAALPGVDQWQGVCSTLFRRANDIYGLDQTFVFAGASGKAMKVGESRLTKLK